MRLLDKSIPAKPRKAQFASVAVLACGIIASCHLPKEEAPVQFPSPDCSDMNMTLEQVDRCFASKENFPPLFSVTPAVIRVVTETKDNHQTERKVELAPGCNENMSRVGPFCIDQYEDYVVEATDGGEKVHNFYDLLGQGQYTAKTEKGVFPQAHISGEQAEAACKNAGKRLCTKEEWQSACMGSQGFTYSYGNEPIPGKCNSGKIWQPGVLFGRGPFNLNDPRLNQLPGGLAKTGDNPECTSDHKVYDMVGNLHEWVSTRADASMISGSGKTNVPGVFESPGNGMFMGGFYTLNGSCRYRIIAHPFSHYDYSTGFRCCMDPK